MRRPAPIGRVSVVALLAAIVALAPATPAIAESAASAPHAPSATPAARPIAARPIAPTPAARSAADTQPAGATAALGDPLESAECQRALAALSSEEAAVAESSRASGGITANDRRLIDAKLAPVRRQAARACLARLDDPATLSSVRLVRPPPIAVAPAGVAPASSPAPMAATARAAPPAPAPLPAEKPYAITSCDAGGCWANDGSRLNRVGPNLWGPRGICTVQGSLLQCP